jgi:hypothetical protein
MGGRKIKIGPSLSFYAKSDTVFLQWFGNFSSRPPFKGGSPGKVPAIKNGMDSALPGVSKKPPILRVFHVIGL